MYDMNYIPLDRQFSPVPKNRGEAESNEFLSNWGYFKHNSWEELEQEFRCVILAEAGAGKTVEFLQYAKKLESNGKLAFYIRIEDIASDFYNAFEVGTEDQFRTWLQSLEEAWFFLDSVDEARLDSPKAFEKSMRRLAKTITKDAQHRAHIYISSRPYAWRPSADSTLLDDILFIPAENQEEANGDRKAKPKSALAIYSMRQLDQERIRAFCMARSANEVDRLLQEIERANLWSLAERPFDLEGILAKWETDSSLGSRLELLRHNIGKRLSDDHNVDRVQLQPLSLERAREGARRLSAAVVLTGKVGINVPDATLTKPGIDAEAVLNDWDPQDVQALLERGIFNDVIYGAVRFRHREVRELLAAEWFNELLKSGNSRHSVEALFFREQYEEKIISPRLRPILPWLILFDAEICERSLKLHPEIAIEGGDPSRLPLTVRKKILDDIIRKIVSNEISHSARDNKAIARIANQDLAEKTQELIKEYCNNDDAIFFLGRLVWQGKMSKCTKLLFDIAADNRREIYARIASTRAVMSCGSSKQKQTLWKNINEIDSLIPRELLAELLEGAVPDRNNVDLLLISLGKLPPKGQFHADRLGSSLDNFVDRLAIAGEQKVLEQFLDGAYSYLEKPPFVEKRDCRISAEHVWLLSSAARVVEKLIEKRSLVVLDRTALSILQMIPSLRYWRDDDLNIDKERLHILVRDWPELNDALYWSSVDLARFALFEKSKESLTSDWPMTWPGHFWYFGKDDMTRLLEYLHSRPFQDDKLVALSTAFQIYMQSDKQAQILHNIQDAVAGNPVLEQQLDLHLNPPVSELSQKYDKEHEEFLRQQEIKKEQEKQNREIWINELKNNPDRISNPPDLNPGEITKNHVWLMSELQNQPFGYSGFAHWEALTPDFGPDVARAYRDSAVNHWLQYTPTLRSEGVENKKIPYSLIFGLAGLEIEANENSEFPDTLDESQIQHALRYITWELNGFPGWLERMYRAFPDEVVKAVKKELLWELENTNHNEVEHYILYDLAFHAPWLHTAIAPLILKWAESNPSRIKSNKHYCMNILANGTIMAARLAEFVTARIDHTDDPENKAWWYAFLVDCNPEEGIPKLKERLEGLENEAATQAAQVFITTLMTGGYLETSPTFGLFKDVNFLKSLYLLMHKFIRAEEDLNHVGERSYAPVLRDHAQHARNSLFSLMAETPGKKSYTTILQLAQEHPIPSNRRWMAAQAHKRAELDGDLDLWSAEQVCAFHSYLTITPATHRQLFDLTVSRLQDLKNWLERGNDSLWRTWQRIQKETEMRTNIAHWLNDHCHEQYTTAEEPEIANSQRMDILLQNPSVPSPVPIELKILDKWSGPQLCERLRNQLAGDYLREEGARCGVMLLVWQGRKPRRWKIDNRIVELSELDSALDLHWQGVASKFPGVDTIQIVVIDLTQRGLVSDT